jgi:hypothetical protein
LNAVVSRARSLTTVRRAVSVSALDRRRHAQAQRSFRRVRGYKQMPQLVAALRRHAHPNPARRPETVRTAAYIRWDRHRNSTNPVTPSGRLPWRWSRRLDRTAEQPLDNDGRGEPEPDKRSR